MNKPEVVNFETPQRFINRELSSLNFQFRVLAEASSKRHPLLERVMFLSIADRNMDEFFMVRVAALKGQQAVGLKLHSDNAMTATEQLVEIRQQAIQFREMQQKTWTLLKQALARQDIHVPTLRQLSAKEKSWLKTYIRENVFPALTPIAIDPAHPFPFIPNGASAIAFVLQRKRDKKWMRALIPLPPKLPRFIRLQEQKKYVPLEVALETFFEEMFPNFTIHDHGMFRVIRDSEIETAEEAQDLVKYFSTALKQRRRGNVISLLIDKKTPQRLRQFIIDEYKVAEEDTYLLNGLIGLADLQELYEIEEHKLKYDVLQPRFPERIHDHSGNCFNAIASKDIVVHHPYESFEVVVDFLKQAAKDPQVLAIKQTLYRTSPDSPIVKALIEAAEAGKSVTALVELKARFDEEANIELARNLERAGAQVVYGFFDLKTHAKLSIVVRQEGKKMVNYTHFGTGNYHPINAKIYTDLSFFTCDPVLCSDALKLFNFVTGYARPEGMEKLYFGPRTLRDKLLDLIEDEIKNAKRGKPAMIWAKMNALVDKKLIDALYRASNAGVKIDLVVRGICCLRPGLEGLSKNIKVKSIVGRFLEHARIFCFAAGHGLPSEQAKVYISSADWMPRNMDYRIEVMVPIENHTVHKQVLNQVMVANLLDTENSWRLASDGSYAKVKPGRRKKFSAHNYFIQHPSLSGRGATRKAGDFPPELLLEEAES